MDIVEIMGGTTEQGFSLYAIQVNNRCLVQEYIDGLGVKYQTQIINLFHQVTTTGLPKNEERFRPIGDKIYELKTRNGVRVLCFFAGPILRKTLVLTHGFLKPGRKIFQREKNKAMNWHQEYTADEVNIIS